MSTTTAIQTNQFACPACGAAAGEDCITRTGKPAKAPHSARKAAAIDDTAFLAKADEQDAPLKEDEEERSITLDAESSDDEAVVTTPTELPRTARVNYTDARHFWKVFRTYTAAVLGDVPVTAYQSADKTKRWLVISDPHAEALATRLTTQWAESMRLLRLWKKAAGVTPAKVGGNAASLRRETEFLLQDAKASAAQSDDVAC